MDYERKLYRARDGMLLGVCLGVARHRDIPIIVLRIGIFLLILFTGIWPGVALYLLAAVLLKPEPLVPPQNQEEAGFYARFANSRAVALHELSQRMERLGTRLGRIEDTVTREDFDWEARLKRPAR
jgi:Putative stress-responsive transcriptional regulator